MSGTQSPDFGRDRSKLDQSSADFGQHPPNSGRIRAEEVADFGPISDKSDQHLLSSVELCRDLIGGPPVSAKHGSNSDKFGRLRRMCTHFHQSLTKIDEIWATPAGFGTDSTEFGPDLPNFGGEFDRFPPDVLVFPISADAGFDR